MIVGVPQDGIFAVVVAVQGSQSHDGGHQHHHLSPSWAVVLLVIAIARAIAIAIGRSLLISEGGTFLSGDGTP